jgi:hypothetical protein
MKRQERKAQAYKLITEKRIAAYENIIGIVKTASLGAVRIENGERLSCPMIFLFEAKEYGSWFAHYVETTRNVTYLVDYKLNHKLLNFFNYLHYLEEYIKPLRGENGKWKNEEIVKKLGTIIRQDFDKLTSEIEAEISKFFSSTIFKEKFVPPTLTQIKYELPEDFSELALFKKEEDIKRLLEES